MKGFASSAAYSYSLVFHSLLNGVLLVPYLIVQVGSAAYAHWLVLSSVALMMQMFDPGFGQVTTERLRKAKNLGQHQDIILSSAALSTVIIALVQLIGISLLVAFPSFPGDQKLNLLVLFATSLILLENMLYGVFLGLSKEGTAAITSITSIAVSFSIVIIGIEAGIGLTALAFGLCVKPLVCIAAAIIILGIELKNNGIEKIPKISWRKIFFLRRELMLSARGKFLISGANGFDVAILGALFEPLMVVAYVMTKRASDFLKMFIQKPTLALHPKLSEYENSDQCHSEKISQYSSTALYTASFAASAYFLLNESFLEVWLPEHHYAGDTLCFIFAITFALSVFQGHAYVINSAFGRYDAVARSQSLYSLLVIILLLFSGVFQNIVLFSLMPAVAILMTIKHGNLIEVSWLGGCKTLTGIFLIFASSVLINYITESSLSNIAKLVSGLVFGSLFLLFFMRQHILAAKFEKRRY